MVTIQEVLRKDTKKKKISRQMNLNCRKSNKNKLNNQMKSKNKNF